MLIDPKRKLNAGGVRYRRVGHRKMASNGYPTSAYIVSNVTSNSEGLRDGRCGRFWLAGT